MNALDKAIEKLNADYKKQIVRLGTEQIYVEKIPLSSPRANYMTYGGIPIGKGTEFFGPEGGGKTTSALDATAQAQKKARNDFGNELGALRTELETLEEKNNKSDQKRITKLRESIKELEERGPKRCIYVDLENTLDEEWAQKIGVDTDELYLMRPDAETAEEVLQMILDLLETGMVILLVIDSLPMLVSQKIYDENLDKKTYGGIADTVAAFCSKATPIINKFKTALIIINQIREDLQNPHNLYKTPGGRALKHWYSLRMYFRKGMFINKDNEELTMKASTEPAGNMVDIHIVKTKVCKPDRRVGQYTIKYNDAIDVLNDTVFMAIKYGFITKNGAWFYLVNQETGEVMTGADDAEIKFQGEAKLLDFLRSDDEIFDEIYEAVNAKLAEVS